MSEPKTHKCCDLDVGAVLTYVGLNAVNTRELPNYVGCTEHQ